MNALLRTAVVALAVGLLTLGVFGLRFAWSPSDILREIRRGEEIQGLRRITDRRTEARQKAVQEYIAQRRTLAETMQRFQESDHEWPYYDAVLWKCSSDDEKHYRQLIGHVEGALEGRPEELAAVLRRLEKDYQQLQASREHQRSETSGR
jgi:septal ring factor EnvC (AmiA/AmiB activator)